MGSDGDPIVRAQAANAVFHPVSIDGDLVTRPASAATETIHSLLRHVRSRGVTGVPEPVAIDNGVERLRFIEGESGPQGWYHQHTDDGLRSAARLLRTIHDAGQDWTPPSDAVFGSSQVDGVDVVFCHGDPGPWNFVWHGDEAIALIDWDYLHPAPRIDDVAYALRWFAPMRNDEHVRAWHHFPTIPDRRARVRSFIYSYGDLVDFDVVSAVLRVMQESNDFVLHLANQGIEPQRSWVADGSQEREADEMAWIVGHRAELTP